MSGPGFHQGLHQRQSQQLVLAPQMRQSLKILQVAALDLRATIQEELQSNPTLEEMPMDDISIDKTASAASKDDAGPDTDQREEMEFKDDFKMLEKIGQDWRDSMSDNGGVRANGTEDEEKRRRQGSQKKPKSSVCVFAVFFLEHSVHISLPFRCLPSDTGFRK